ncbi:MULTISPECIES: non-heme ferritin [Pasteurellaceae]|uniref:Ferritin n=1 Tax=Pasteurella atlantica TaxID=2827233 RepID=A0AAW8CRE2_9PAST|nr:non-heme ferritin [Pasteurella atlantica]MBR0573988.1 non-heme ferritin [Pasteurella atlantica]MDP8039951.1 non-heme ferritin [Pasteurella atlantica]MDP8042027.1 non-heme ferritin [Pasteurella atlantica]MDP8044212.1 non-heme ferritin [Pasteurella atlantica]MDP8046223.1 non-heme ferritin [Pasteurella atlantica]
MLSNKIITMLNEQLNLELYSSNLYLQMSAWCTNKGYEGAAIFLREHATEEMVHMRKLFTYLNETGAYTTIAEIEAPKSEFSSLKEVLELTFEHEKLITKKINELVEITLAEKDFASFNFLQWYVSEQHEEETLFGGILDKLNLLGQDSKGLYYIDKELVKLVTA